VHHGEHRHGARRRGRPRRWRLDRHELAAGGAVDDVPPAVAQALADGIRGCEIARAAKLYALGDELLSLGLIRSSWL
jgi:hypothetical protein